ncbi:MAG TPA: ABC transporter ATP-binding protein [Acidimicrobiales bacterium]|nr:ABC transporter ATP-binding protein [Acidimicrobiales bacterium]
MATPQYVYELDDVQRTFRKGGVEVKAVRGVSFNIERGELLSLQGKSGSGKSTLLMMLGALEVPTAGTIRFDGRDLGRESARVLTGMRGESIGFVFQQFNLIPTLTAEENVALAMVPARQARPARLARSRELLERVGLGDRLRHLPSRLSGGEQQRVAIARALARSPEVIIADEPTGNLDSDSSNEVVTMLTDLNKNDGVTVIVATHDDEIAALASRRLRLKDGMVVSDVRS